MGARASNSAVLEWTGAGTVTHISLWKGANSSAAWQGDEDVTDQALTARFAVGALTLTVRNSEYSQANDVVACDARKGECTHIQIHSGPPGTSHNANVIAGINADGNPVGGGRKAISWSASVGGSYS